MGLSSGWLALISFTPCHVVSRRTEGGSEANLGINVEDTPRALLRDVLHRLDGRAVIVVGEVGVFDEAVLRPSRHGNHERARRTALMRSSNSALLTKWYSLPFDSPARGCRVVSANVSRGQEKERRRTGDGEAEFAGVLLEEALEQGRLASARRSRELQARSLSGQREGSSAHDDGLQGLGHGPTHAFVWPQAEERTFAQQPRSERCNPVRFSLSVQLTDSRHGRRADLVGHQPQLLQCVARCR
jgi:hypothetical protein